MKHTRSIVALLALTFTLCFQALPVFGHTQDSPPALIARLLDQSGYSFTKAADGVWTIAFRGKALPQFNVVATTQQDIVVLFVIVAGKKELSATPEVMAKLLKLNGDLDRVKVGIDGDGDTFVRVDLSARVVDLQEFKANVEQVAAAADEVYGAIKPHITTAR